MSKKASALSFKVLPLDIAEYLDNEEAIAEFLSAALEIDSATFLSAMAEVAKARGMTRVAAEAGLTRASLYKTLAPGAKPQHDTVIKLLKSLGLQLSIRAQRPKNQAARRVRASSKRPAARD